MTTQSSTGFTGSETSACNGWLCSGSRTPAIAETTELTGGRDSDLASGDLAAAGFDAGDPAAIGADRGDLAILDDIDTARIGGPRIAPGDRVVPRDPAAPLQCRAEHRIARVGRDVEDRTEALDVGCVEPFGVDAV